MNEKETLLDIFGELSPENQVQLLRYAQLSRIAEDAVKEAMYKPQPASGMEPVNGVAANQKVICKRR
jgi:hypothetical protein